jgi:small subunit ribosomal protein S13
MEVVRIAGVELPKNKQIAVALTYVKGVGHSLAKKVLSLAKVDEEKRTEKLSDEEIKRIRAELESGRYHLEGELRQKQATDIRLLREIRCYRGVRHMLGLPVRGQQTRTNCRTRKGKSLPVGGLKVKLEKK